MKYFFVLLWGPLFVGPPVRPNMLNMPKSASDYRERKWECIEADLSAVQLTALTAAGDWPLTEGRRRTDGWSSATSETLIAGEQVHLVATRASSEREDVSGDPADAGELAGAISLSTEPPVRPQDVDEPRSSSFLWSSPSVNADATSERKLSTASSSSLDSRRRCSTVLVEDDGSVLFEVQSSPTSVIGN